MRAPILVAALFLTSLAMFQNCSPGFVLSSNFLSSSGLAPIDQSAIDQNPLADADWTVTSAAAKQGLPLIFKITLAQPLAKDASFGFQTIDGTAKSGEEFTPFSGNVAIAAGQSEVEILIPTISRTRELQSKNFALQVIQKTTKEAAGQIRAVYRKMPPFKKFVESFADPGGCGITLDDRVLCFGGIRGSASLQGILGTADQYGSVEISGMTGVIDIVANIGYCAVKSTGEIFCWRGSALPIQADLFPGERIVGLTIFRDPPTAGVLCAMNDAKERVCRNISAGFAAAGPIERLTGVESSIGVSVLLSTGALMIGTQSANAPQVNAGNARKIFAAIIFDGYDVIAEMQDATVQCLSVGFSNPTTLRTPVDLSVMKGFRRIEGGCRSGSALDADGKTHYYLVDAATRVVSLTPRPQAQAVMDILGSGRCLRMADNTFRCRESPLVMAVNGPMTGMSQFPYSFAAQKDLSPKLMGGDCIFDSIKGVYCGVPTASRVIGLDGFVPVRIVTSATRSALRCAIDANGSTRCWSRDNLAKVLPVTGIKDLSLHGRNGCAIADGGVAKCWAWMDPDLSLIENIDIGNQVGEKIAIVVNSQLILLQVCISSADRMIRCFSSDGQTATNFALSRTLDVGEPIASIQLSNGLLSLSTSGRVRAWKDPAPFIENISLLRDIVELKSGLADSCAREKSGRVWCWGRNEYGQFGTGRKKNYLPVLETTLPLHTAELAFGGELAQSLDVGGLYVSIIPVSGGLVKTAGFLFTTSVPPFPEIDVLDYAP